MKSRVSALQMGVKMETPAKVNPELLAQPINGVIYNVMDKAYSTDPDKGLDFLFCGIVLGLVIPMSRQHLCLKQTTLL